MKTKSIAHHIAESSSALIIFVAALLICLTGCQTNTHHDQLPSLSPPTTKDAVLREADELKIVFPGTPNLDTVQTIRRDGKITMPMVGEITATGKTPADLQQELIGLYANQLVSAKQITVMVQSSSFPVFVTGAVQKTGKLTSDHPMTVVEAIMEAGGPDYSRANLKAVKVIRVEGKQTKNYTLNLKGIVNGTVIDNFYLQPSDIVYVPEKITWF